MREYGFLVRCCTSREATNFGIFLNEVLAMVERWRVSGGGGVGWVGGRVGAGGRVSVAGRQAACRGAVHFPKLSAYAAASHISPTLPCPAPP